MDSIPQKTCTKCGETYSATPEFFTRDKNKPDGLFSWCKPCKSSSDKYYRNLPEARQRDFDRKRSPEYRERNREYARSCREDPEKNKVILGRKRSPEYRALERASKKALRQKPRYRLLHNIRNHNRRARNKLLEAHFSDTDWLNCLLHFNHSCAVCGRPQGLWHTLAADHWIPLSHPNCPGTVPVNIVPLCHGIGGCNNKKGDRQPDEWLFGQFTNAKARSIIKKIQGYFECLN